MCAAPHELSFLQRLRCSIEYEGIDLRKTTNAAPHGRAGTHRLAGQRFYPGGLVLDTVSGQFYRLTPAADYLLREYDAGADVRDFAGLIEARYGRDHASALRDVELLLNQFAGPGFLEQGEPEGTT